MGGTKNKKKRTPTAPAVRAETPDESGGTEPEERSEDAASDSGRREADLREADSSLDLRSREKEIDRDRAAAFAKFERRQAREADDAGVDPKVALLEAELDLMRERLAARSARAAAASGDQRRSTWKPNSLRPLPSEAPPMHKPGSMLALRRAVIEWLGSYSFVLRLSTEERKMLTSAELDLHRENRDAFLESWTPASLNQLQHDTYLELKRHLARSILVAPLFTQVTTEHANCATRLWDALLLAFPPRSPQVIAEVIAEAAVTILRGPDHDAEDSDKAFRKWDAAVGTLNQTASDMPPFDSKMLCTYLMFASLHSSKEDAYYQAYSQLQTSLAQSSATFDAVTVRAAAMRAFQAEQRRRSSTSRAPDSVEAFAAFGSAPRRPVTGTPTAHATCCQCPHHCVLPDGTFRVVRSVAAHQALVPPEFDYCPGVSAKTLHAFKCYKAAVEDKGSSRDEIARLAQTFEVQRQADKERAMYYRLQDQESAMLAVTGYDDFDGDDDL